MCVSCARTESSGADVAGSKALQRHDEPGTPAGLRGKAAYLLYFRYSVQQYVHLYLKSC